MKTVKKGFKAPLAAQILSHCDEMISIAEMMQATPIVTILVIENSKDKPEVIMVGVEGQDIDFVSSLFRDFLSKLEGKGVKEVVKNDDGETISEKIIGTNDKP